jgi:hypothetical protein
MDGLGGEFKPCKGRNGYSYGASIERDGRALCRVFWGGVHQKDTTHALASSEAAPAFAEFMRKLYPVHAVTRCDIAADWDEPGLYDRIKPVAKALADRFNIVVDERAPTLRDVVKGRTLYLGSRSSPHFMRIYEKGLEQISKGVSDASPHWLRVESEIKPPKKPQRFEVATLKPLDLVGVSPFGRELWSTVLGFECEALELYHSLKGSDDKALDTMCEQYGRVLSRLLLQSGSPAAFGVLLASRVAEFHPAVLRSGST